MSGSLSAEQLRKFRGYAGRAFTLDELRDLFGHVDALTTENDALKRRLAAAEADARRWERWACAASATWIGCAEECPAAIAAASATPREETP